MARSHSVAEWATLPAMHSQLALETADSMRALQCFLSRQRVLRVHRNPVPRVLPHSGEATCGSPLGALDPTRPARLLKAGILSMASIPDWEQRVGARPYKQSSPANKGLIWSNMWCEVEEAGSMNLCGKSGSALRIINLKRSQLDSVRGSLHAVIEENKEVESVMPDKYKNLPHLYTRDGQPVLNLPPAEVERVNPSPLFLKFANDIEKTDWVDALLLAGVSAGPGIQNLENAKTFETRATLKSRMCRDANNPRSSMRSPSVDPKAFEDSLAPAQVAQRHAVMFDYSGAAPISRRSLNMLPFDPVERSIIQSPVGSPFPRGAHPKGAASTAAHLPGDPIIHLGRDLIRMHGRAVQARKGHDFIEGSLSLRRQSTWRTSEGGIKGLSKVTSVQHAPKAAQSLPASLRPLVQDVR